MAGFFKWACTRAARDSRKYMFNSKLSRPQNRSFSSEKGHGLIKVEKIGKISLISLNRPEKRNAVNRAMATELCEAFDAFERDEDSSVAILFGEGGTFCAGYDLSEVATTDTTVDPWSYLAPGNGPMGPTRRVLSKPTIAAVSGYAVAGGLELALMCDLRIVEETAIMGVFCRRFGVPLIDGGTVRLPQLIGLSRALDLILTGRPVSGKEACDIGLAYRVVATGAGHAIHTAHQIAKFPQGCLNKDRLSAYNAAYDAKSLDDALNYERQNVIEILSEEAIKGAQTFTQGVGKGGRFNEYRKQAGGTKGIKDTV